MKINPEPFLTLPIKLILGKKRRTLDDHTFKRLQFLCFAFVVAFFYAGGLFLSDLSLKKVNHYSLFLDAWMIFTVVSLSILLRFTSFYRFAFYAAVLSTSLVIPAGYFAPTGNRTIFLAPVVLIVAYFTLGRRGGVIWTGYMFGAHILSYEIDASGIARMSISGQVLAYASLAMGITSVLLFIYEGVNMANERRVAERDEKLREAIENINHLNEQLRQEKASVEKQVEQRTYELHEEQARLQASIATLELGFLMTLKDQQITTYNPALLRICDFPLKVDELTLENVYEKLASTYDLKSAIAKCLATGQSFEAQDIELGNKYIRILGSVIHLQHSGEPLGVVLLFEDRTAAKLLERSENEFVAIASHELRTPLTIIEGNISLLEKMLQTQFVNDKTRHMLESVKESTARMIAIVNQFLTMARLEQKKTVFDLQAIDVVQSVNDTLATVQPLVDKKNLQLRVEFAPHLPRVRADAGRFQEILANLVSNSVKYTEAGYIEVSATQENNFIVIRVSDTGRGMSPDNQRLLFHKFQQATDNIYTRDDSRSTGLGLYISKLLIEQMGGKISLEASEPGKGSTFSVRLPIA